MYLTETSLKNLEQYKLDIEQVDMYYIKNWLDDVELRTQVKNLIDKHAKPSSVKTTGDTDQTDYRTSSTYHFADNPDNRDYIRLQDKITETMGISEDFAEPLQGTKYEVGEYFKEHTDFFDRRFKNFDAFAKGNQRTWTFMAYLNDVEEGGCTLFQQLRVQFKPVAGSALIWNNLYEQGQENYWTSHQALPPVSGQKFIVTQWYRQRPFSD